MNVSLRKIATSLIVLGLCGTAASAAQEATPAPRAATAQGAPSPAALDYVEVTGFKSQIFEVKHRDPASLMPVLRPLASGFKGATIAASNEFRTLSVRDWPENLAAIGEAIRRLDVSEASRADFELHLHVLVATPTGPSSELPLEIRGAVEQLQSAFNFKGFTMLTPIVQRTREGDWNTEGNGQITGGPERPGVSNKIQYHYSIRAVRRSSDPSGGEHVVLDGFEFTFVSSFGEARVQSNLSLRAGDQVVVGTASLLNGQALVLILSASVTK